MKNLSAEHTLLAALPILLVTLAIIGALVFFPKENTDIRGRASEPKVTPSLQTIPTATATPAPETICSELYNPVCGTNNYTYTSSCEASLAGVTIAHTGPCTTNTSNTRTPQTVVPTYSAP